MIRRQTFGRKSLISFVSHLLQFQSRKQNSGGLLPLNWESSLAPDQCNLRRAFFPSSSFLDNVSVTCRTSCRSQTSTKAFSWVGSDYQLAGNRCFLVLSLTIFPQPASPTSVCHSGRAPSVGQEGAWRPKTQPKLIVINFGCLNL